MQSLFAALFELIKETPRTERGVKTDSSILLIYPPDKEPDFREYLLDSFIPHRTGQEGPVHSLGPHRFPVPGSRLKSEIEDLQEDEFDDYRWMQQGLSQRVEAALGTAAGGTDFADARCNGAGFLHRRSAPPRSLRRGSQRST